ncbi:type IV pilus assembly protein PilM [Curtobacterium sp. MCBA15_004]|uniref:type IV pilus assembly protein PilM n=1 Tax=unclassified Curtobacterium TaxID=257496 RepID=UPI0008DE765D|nr:type IV pilus assembly protein PilM [Curtobacterium sp. MCBA15_004]WIA96635.1 type IV pilus assembly protein PilM [Curtobacterium sp. MCBA15_004]
MAKTLVGIDIGGDTIRAVEVANPDKPDPVILRVAEVPLVPGSTKRGEVLEPNTVAASLRELWRVGRFRSKDVVLGMGNQRVLSRDLTVPKAPLAQIRESLPFQVQDMLPVPVGDAILDFYPVSESTTVDGPVVHGLLIAAVKDSVLANVRAVQLAGLNPVGVDLIPFALTRVYLPASRYPGTHALAEVGANTTTVVIATDGVPQFVRVIPSGGDDLTGALGAALDIPLDQAEPVKRWIGMGGRALTADDRRAEATIRDLSTELLTSLRNTVNYFVSTRPGTTMAGIVLAGGGAHLPGFAGALGTQTGLPVAIGDAFSDAATNRSVRSEDLAERGHAVAVAWGLARGSVAA